MKRWVPIALLGLCLASGPAQATVTGVEVGIFGGLSVPVAQDVNASSLSPSDAFGDTGTQFGLRVPVVVIPVVTLEPYYAKSSYADRDETFAGISYTREGFDGTAFGLNAILGRPSGPGVKFYPFVGIGKNKLERSGTEIDEIGYNFGLGLGISPATKFSIQVRGEFNMVVTGDTSRKFTGANVGVNYSLLP